MQRCWWEEAHGQVWEVGLGLWPRAWSLHLPLLTVPPSPPSPAGEPSRFSVWTPDSAATCRAPLPPGEARASLRVGAADHRPERLHTRALPPSPSSPHPPGLSPGPGPCCRLDTLRCSHTCVLCVSRRPAECARDLLVILGLAGTKGGGRGGAGRCLGPARL